MYIDARRSGIHVGGTYVSMAGKEDAQIFVKIAYCIQGGTLLLSQVGTNSTEAAVLQKRATQLTE